MTDKIVKLDETDSRRIVDLFCAAFYDYPVMRYVLQNNPQYDKNLWTLINFFVMARVLRKETIFGVQRDDQFIAAATTSNPHKTIKIPALGQVRKQTWNILGSKARERYDRLGHVWADLDEGIPNVHLNMLAVLPQAQGSGAGRLLLEKVHELSRQEVYSQGVTLTTEDPANVSLYEYMGYKITGQVQLEEGLQTWNFFRPD